MAPNYSAAATLNIPIFQGGKVEADMREADGRTERAPGAGRQPQGPHRAGSAGCHPRLERCRPTGGSRQDRPRLRPAGCRQSQDRFAAGVTNNVEVIQAQQQLAAANDQSTSASLFTATTSPRSCWRAPSAMPKQMVKQYLAGDAALPPSVVAPAPTPATARDAATGHAARDHSAQPNPSNPSDR